MYECWKKGIRLYVICCKEQIFAKEPKMAAYKNVILPSFLYGGDSRVPHEIRENKSDGVEIEYLRSMCDKTRRDRVKDEWVLNKCRLKTKPRGKR